MDDFIKVMKALSDPNRVKIVKMNRAASGRRRRIVFAKAPARRDGA